MLYCIVGLPGSGKSNLAKKLKTTVINCEIIDDIQKLKENFDFHKDKNYIIVDATFCFKESREKFKQFILINSKNSIPEIIWIFFENNPEQCKINLKERKDGRTVSVSVDLFSKNYEIDKGEKILPVYKKE